MNLRTYHDEVGLKVLGQALGANYTQSFATLHSNCERVVFVLIGHASVNVAFNVTAAVDAAGNDPTDLLATAIICDDAGKAWTIEVGPGGLPAGKPYISAKVVRTGGTYTLLQELHSLRNPGSFTQDATYAVAESKQIVI